MKKYKFNVPYKRTLKLDISGPGILRHEKRIENNSLSDTTVVLTDADFPTKACWRHKRYDSREEFVEFRITGTPGNQSSVMYHVNSNFTNELTILYDPNQWRDWENRTPLSSWNVSGSYNNCLWHCGYLSDRWGTDVFEITAVLTSGAISRFIVSCKDPGWDAPTNTEKRVSGASNMNILLCSVASGEWSPDSHLWITAEKWSDTYPNVQGGTDVFSSMDLYDSQDRTLFRQQTGAGGTEPGGIKVQEVHAKNLDFLESDMKRIAMGGMLAMVLVRPVVFSSDPSLSPVILNDENM